jgi:hypothetical protein
MSDDAPRQIASCEIPMEQKFSFRLVPQDGRLVDMKTFGLTLSSLAELHAAMMQEDFSTLRFKTCIVAMGIDPDGGARVEFAILPIDEETK